MGASRYIRGADCGVEASQQIMNGFVGLARQSHQGLPTGVGDGCVKDWRAVADHDLAAIFDDRRMFGYAAADELRHFS
jgi:hypothetical protein